MKKVVVGNEYFELVRRFPLRPIVSASDLDAATAVIDDLIARESRTADEDAYLDVLSDVVEKYEAEHHPIPDARGAEMLQFLIEDRKTNQRAVAQGSGIAVSTISQLLSGLRQMNVGHMEALARYFDVPASMFISATAPATSSKKRIHRQLATQPMAFNKKPKALKQPRVPLQHATKRRTETPRAASKK